MFAPQWARPFRFQKAGLGLLPLLEGADRDLLLEQGSGTRGGEAALTRCALGTQETIRCGRAHGEQLVPALLRDVEVLMSLKRLYQGREKGDEAFGADAVGRAPGQEQRVLDVWSRLGSHACTQAHAIRPPHG